MTVLRWLALLLGLGLLQSFLPAVWQPFQAIDWLLVPVVHQALRLPFRRAVMVGAVAGLVHDGVSGGMLGLHGFSKTVVAAVIAGAGNYLVVRGSLPEGIVTGLAAALESTVVLTLGVILERPVSLATPELVSRAVATGVATTACLAAGRALRQRRLRQAAGRRLGGRR